ncbi:MAG: hypothetical protein HDQ99_05740 [Lachnospiraceae bacterium]|nr:hypothetical protein [Lachnospiraceae bacterium]
MDKNRIKLIFSEKYNQFYKPIRVDEDVGTIYMQITKNHHDKSMKKDEILHIENNPEYAYVPMYDANITAEQHFIKVMSSSCSVNIKLNELKLFKRNMLAESESAMQILKELAESECDPQKDNFLNKKKIHNTALEIYTSLNRRKIVQDKRSTYDGQTIPEEVKKIALSKRLFIERSDDYCGKPKHPTNMNEKLAIQALYPCGFIVRNRGGIVVAGGRYELSMEDAIEFVKNYIPTEKEKHYTNLYQVPMSIRKKRQLAMCYKTLEMYGLHYKNEHNYFFWVLDKHGNVVAGGKNGFGFKWLLSYCRKLKHKPLPKKE